MSCETIRERLDDYVDGLLDADAQEALRLHLADCPACAEEERGLRRLVASARALPRSLAPGRDLWPAIVRRLGSPRESRPARAWEWSGLAAAASLAVVVVLSAWWSSERPRSSSQGQALGTAVPTSYAPATRAAEDEYERAEAAFLTALEARRTRLSPESRARVERSLRVIDEALAEIRAELRENPSDPDLNLLLASTHQRKVDVLRTVVSLTS